MPGKTIGSFRHRLMRRHQRFPRIANRQSSVATPKLTRRYVSSGAVIEGLKKQRQLECKREASRVWGVARIDCEIWLFLPPAGFGQCTLPCLWRLWFFPGSGGRGSNKLGRDSAQTQPSCGCRIRGYRGRSPLPEDQSWTHPSCSDTAACYWRSSVNCCRARAMISPGCQRQAARRAILLTRPMPMRKRSFRSTCTRARGVS